MIPTVWKDNLREIKISFPRFLSIFAIITLGVAFFIGIKATGPAMVETSRQYFDAYHLPDGTVLSTGGLDDSDLEILADHPGAEWLPMKSITTNLRPGTETAKVFTFDGKESTDFFKVVEGRMPETTNEIALDAKFLELINHSAEEPIHLGDKVTLEQPDTYEVAVEDNEPDTSKENDSVGLKAPEFVETEFTVVGFVNTPLYFERISRGMGTVSVFAVVVEEAIVGDIYTEAYFWLNDAREYEAYSDEYNELLEQNQLAVEERLNGQPLARLNALRHDLSKLIQSGQDELDDGYQQLDDASESLSKASKDLEEGWQEYFEGLVEIANAQQEISDGKVELETAQTELQTGWAEILKNETLLNENEATYQAGYQDYVTGLSVFEAGIQSAEAEIAAGETELANAKVILDESLVQLEQAESEIALGRQEIAAAKQTILDEWFAQTSMEFDSVDDLLVYLEQQEASLAQLYEELEKQLEELPQRYDTVRQELASIEAALTAIGMSNQDLIEEQATALTEIEVLNTQIENSEVQLVSEQIELNRLTDEEANLIAKLAVTPPTLPGTPDPETGEETEVVPNPAYLALQQEIATIQADISLQQNVINEILQQQNTAQVNVSSLQQRLIEIDALLLTNENQFETLTEEQVILESQLEILEDSLKEENIAKLNEQLAELKSQRDIIQEQLEQLREAVRQISAPEEELDAAEQELAAGWEQYDSGYAEYEQGIRELEVGRETLEMERTTGQQQLDEALLELQSGREALDDGYAQIEVAKQQLIEGENQLAEALESLQAGEAELNQGQVELAEGYVSLTEGTQVLRSNELSFQEESEEALAELEQGQADLDEAKNELAELEQPIYYVTVRQDAEAYASVYENAEKLNVISNIFPVFFFAIAVLVTFTTVKRMASEQRNYMGTMKQMGYPNHIILSKFVFYAGVASVMGVIAGTIIGYQLFPGLIVNAYNSLYYFDDIYLVYSPIVVLLVAIIALSCAIGPAILTPLSILRSKPAQLLQPEPPKAGQTIMLERIGWLWGILSFKRKMTIRNLLRYKGRNTMTLVGIAGCTMLIATGFGISDTVSIIVDKQFGEIQTFSSMMFLSEDYSEDELLEFRAELHQDERFDDAVPLMTQTLETNQADQAVQAITVVVPLVEEEYFAEFVHLHQRKQPDALLQLDEAGPIFTERIAEYLGVESGDSIQLVDDKQQTYDIPIGTIAENYISHYVYLSPKQYEEIFYKKPTINTFFMKYEDKDQHEIERALSEDDRVMTVVNLNSIEQTASESMGSLGFITLVLIVAAAGLAFIVIYNLTNINIAERMRELSTIKVLGFYNREVSMYIYEEILVLTVMGSLIGLVLGRVLTYLILKQMQLNNLLFYPVVHLDSYIISAGLTFVFSSVVMLFMHRKLKNIDMVEALKAVD